MQNQISDTEPVISVSNLTRKYGETTAVDGLSFEVRRGEIFSLLGPNGAGKTTTVSMLEGLIRRDSGSISIFGMDPWKDHNLLKLRIGVMPQEFNFFEKLSPLDSLTFYCELFRSPINPGDLLKLVMLESSGKTPFEKLSGGQKQKLGLALSLVNNPEVLFLDEPTTGLDPSARRAVWSIIEKFREQGKTIVLTTHYMEEAERLSDRVAIISSGRIVSSGTPEEIIARHGSGRKVIVRSNREMADYLETHNIILRENRGNIEIPLPENANLADLVRLVEDSGIKYSQLTVSTDSLEEVFISLVGQMTEGELS